MQAICAASFQGCQRSSESSSPTYAPRASANPRFRALAGPPFRWCRVRTRASPAKSRASRSRVSSVDPSSTTSSTTRGCRSE